MIPGVAPPSGRGDCHLQDGLGFDFEASIQSAADVVGIEKSALADFVDGQIAPALPLAKRAERGAGSFAREADFNAVLCADESSGYVCHVGAYLRNAP